MNNIIKVKNISFLSLLFLCLNAEGSFNSTIHQTHKSISQFCRKILEIEEVKQKCDRLKKRLNRAKIIYHTHNGNLRYLIGQLIFRCTKEVVFVDTQDSLMQSLSKLEDIKQKLAQRFKVLASLNNCKDEEIFSITDGLYSAKQEVFKELGLIKSSYNELTRELNTFQEISSTLQELKQEIKQQQIDLHSQLYELLPRLQTELRELFIANIVIAILEFLFNPNQIKL